MQRGARRLGFRSWTLAALVLASAVLTLTQAANSTLVATGSSSTSSSVCAATSCKLSNGGNCNRTVAGCPVCLQFQTASNVYTCTTVMKTTKACPDGFSTCSSAVTPSPSPTSSPASSPSSAGSSSSSALGQVRAADTLNGGSSQSESGQLHTASIATEAPETTVSTSTDDSGSSFPTWIVIGAGTVVGCIVAAVIGTKYTARKNHAGGGAKNPRDSDGPHSSTKELDTVLDESHGSRDTTTIDFSESTLDLNSTTSKASYTAVDRSTRASTRTAEGSVFLKSDSWRHTNTSSRSVGPPPVPAPMPPPVLAPAPLSHHSFRGSQHVRTMFLDDLQGPLDASQLTTEVSESYRSEANDAFGMSPHSEWMSSGFYEGSNHSEDTDVYDGKISILGDDDDGGNGSGNTEFYSSKISVLGDHEDDDFLRRKSERVEDESVAKWKQKFYVEL